MVGDMNSCTRRLFLCLDSAVRRGNHIGHWSLYSPLEITMAQVDTIIHQPVRLRIMASLVTLELDEQVDFSTLKKLLDVTDGNLGAHISKLEQAGYIALEKTFVDKKPRTFVKATGRGRDAFADHVTALQDILTRPESK